MKLVNIHDAKNSLSRLVEAAAKGEPFVVVVAGRPEVRVEALSPAPEPPRRRLGFMSGAFGVTDDFDRIGQEAISGLFGIGV